jgi:hypothetical protein
VNAAAERVEVVRRSAWRRTGAGGTRSRTGDPEGDRAGAGRGGVRLKGLARVREGDGDDPIGSRSAWRSRGRSAPRWASALDEGRRSIRPLDALCARELSSFADLRERDPPRRSAGKADLVAKRRRSPA